MKVLLFGAGIFGQQYLFSSKHDANNTAVVGFLDNDPRKFEGSMGEYYCYHPERICELDYDKIVIANNTSVTDRAEMYAQLKLLGVSAEKIEFYPSELWHDSRLKFFKFIARYVRDQGIQGNVAECGVNKGRTAERINEFFTDKKLYLFDTFEGFTKHDIDFERMLGDHKFLSGRHNHTGGFDTSVEFVMRRMPRPGNVIIKKGWVPETFEGINDTFCFVHLDMDLYNPMLAALNFFWVK